MAEIAASGGKLEDITSLVEDDTVVEEKYDGEEEEIEEEELEEFEEFDEEALSEAYESGEISEEALEEFDVSSYSEEELAGLEDYFDEGRRLNASSTHANSTNHTSNETLNTK